MATLQRDILKWLQSLDLTWQIRNPKWDLSNGFLIAEVLSNYYPQDILMHSFYNGDSLELKKRNWFILKNFLLKNQFDVNMEDVWGTIHCKEGAAVRLMEKLYICLTNRKIKKLGLNQEVDYSDYAYQMQLPMHQRSTVSKALKNNLRLTEVLADRNVINGSAPPEWYSDRTVMKAQKIINEHMEHRRFERRADPARFGIKPTLGDRCVRHAFGQDRKRLDPSHLCATTESPYELPSDEDTFSEHHLSRESSNSFRKSETQQANMSKFHQQSIESF